MMIAIHDSKVGFHPRWIAYCEAKGIDYKVVNCYASDIIAKLQDCDALMWHFHHAGAKDFIFAKQLLFSVQASGKKVFPDFNTMWHFDSKVGQKYLLEAIGAPLVPTYIFYDKISAYQWLVTTNFPKVFKLSRGAGSNSVMLVNTKSHARKLVRKAFCKGFKQKDAAGLKERWRKYQIGKTNFLSILKGFVHKIYPTQFARIAGPEKGYAYFQDFIPNNDHDIRVVVIGNKAFAIKRMVRANDFRASGSGAILYDKELFNERDIQLAFDIHTKLKSQCTAMDFVYDKGKPKIVEISYGFDPKGYEGCPGYWDNQLNWHQGKFDPCVWMVDTIINNSNY